MVVKIKVKSNTKQIARWLQKVHKKQIPFAAMIALNNTAFDVRKQIVERTYPKAFDLKNQRFPSFVTNVKKAKKDDLTASVGNINGRALDYLVLHAEGGTKRPRGRHLTIPTDKTKRTAKGGISPAEKPRNLMANPTAYVTTINGTMVIAQRKRKTGPTEIKYVLTPTAKIDKTLMFFEDATKVIKKVYDKHFAIALARAIKTAR